VFILNFLQRLSENCYDSFLKSVWGK
jgi:hypothetical protein